MNITEQQGYIKDATLAEREEAAAVLRRARERVFPFGEKASRRGVGAMATAYQAVRPFRLECPAEGIVSFLASGSSEENGRAWLARAGTCFCPVGAVLMELPPEVAKDYSDRAAEKAEGFGSFDNAASMPDLQPTVLRLCLAAMAVAVECSGLVEGFPDAMYGVAHVMDMTQSDDVVEQYMIWAEETLLQKNGRGMFLSV